MLIVRLQRARSVLRSAAVTSLKAIEGAVLRGFRSHTRTHKKETNLREKESQGSV